MICICRDHVVKFCIFCRIPKETGRYRHKAKYRISVKLDQEGNDSVNWASAFIVWYQAS